MLFTPILTTFTLPTQDEATRGATERETRPFPYPRLPECGRNEGDYIVIIIITADLHGQAGNPDLRVAATVLVSAQQASPRPGALAPPVSLPFLLHRLPQTALAQPKAQRSHSWLRLARHAAPGRFAALDGFGLFGFYSESLISFSQETVTCHPQAGCRLASGWEPAALLPHPSGAPAGTAAAGGACRRGKGAEPPPPCPRSSWRPAGGPPHCPRGPQERGWEGGSPLSLFFFPYISASLGAVIWEFNFIYLFIYF